MTKADKIFKRICGGIIKFGISSEGTNVRTVWEDTNEPAHYKSLIGISNHYNVGEEFPMISMRNTGTMVYKAIDEMLWIWQKKSNNINDLNSHIWDQWADENGSIGKAYGYQLGKKYDFKTKDGIINMDQVDYVLYLLKNDPSSRRIMTNIFVHEDLKDMNLEPCVYGTQWIVKDGTLNLILNQRSQDMLAANGWNTMQYAALMHMFAYVNDLKVGTMVHNIGDCHIYDRHIPMVEKLLSSKGTNCKPQLRIREGAPKDFYKLTVDDFEITGYYHDDTMKIGKVPVAK